MQVRETKIKPEKQDIVKREASLARQASPARSKATPRNRQPERPSRACQGPQKQNHLTNHSTTTHVVDQCGLKLQDDQVAAIRHMAAISYK
jgi:hypothetical protein